MPSLKRAALPPLNTITSEEDRDVGSPRYSFSAGHPPFSPITPTFSPITPTFCSVTPTTMEKQKDELIAQLYHENGVLMAKNRVLLQHIRTIVPDLKLSHVGSPSELRWLTGDDADRFCMSPDGNARNLDGEQYLNEVLEEAETERKFSEDWRAGMDTGYERGHVIERRGGQGGIVYREPVALPDKLPARARAHEEEKAIAAFTVAPSAAPIAALGVAGKQRKRGNSGEGVATRKQAKRACKVKRDYKQ